MSQTRFAWTVLAICLTCSACTEGVDAQYGPSSYVRFHDGNGNYAQHFHERLPGTQAEKTGSESRADEEAATPTVNYDTAPGWVYQGQSNAKFSGKLSRDAVAIGLSVPDVTHGYWVRPAGLPDPQTQELTWEASLDVSDDVTPGYHDVVFVAIDGNGHAGTQLLYRLCVRSRVPDNFNACDPTSDAPEAVISLKWDANVDLDLQVIDSHGNLVDGKHPATMPVGTAVAPDAGVLDRDSNAGCFLDGVRFENLVWNKVAPSGRYGIYVNLFDACKQPTVHFEVSVYSSEALKDSKKAVGRVLKRYYVQSGVLMDYQVGSGDGRGLFITEFDFK